MYAIITKWEDEPHFNLLWKFPDHKSAEKHLLIIKQDSGELSRKVIASTKNGLLYEIPKIKLKKEFRIIKLK